MGIRCWAIQAKVSWIAQVGLVVMITISCFLAQIPEGVNGPWVGVEVPEQGVPVVVPGPLPELTHVLEVSEAGNGIPGFDGIRRQFRSVLHVVPPDPPGVEVGHNPVEIDTQIAWRATLDRTRCRREWWVVGGGWWVRTGPGSRRS